MTSQQIRARRAAVLINIPAPAQVKVLLGIPVAENTKLAIAPTGIIGVVQNAQRILVAAIHGVTHVSQMQLITVTHANQETVLDINVLLVYIQ